MVLFPAVVYVAKEMSSISLAAPTVAPQIVQVVLHAAKLQPTWSTLEFEELDYAGQR